MLQRLDMENMYVHNSKINLRLVGKMPKRTLSSNK